MKNASPFEGMHSEDFRNAFLARLRRKIGRDKTTAKAVMEVLRKEFVTLLADTSPEQWTDDVWETVKAQAQATQLGPYFLQRVVRATTKVATRPRAQLFSKMETLMLQNWRTLRLNAEQRDALEGMPGLQHGLRYWEPVAAVELLRKLGVHTSARWFEKRRKQLGLKPGKLYRVECVDKDQPQKGWRLQPTGKG
jgi:hypothetical protein